MISRLKFVLAPLAPLVLAFGIFTAQILPLAALTTLVATQTACPFNKADAVKWGERAVSGLKEALPLLQNAGVNTANITEGIDIGEKLFAALKANNDASALGLTGSLITAFEGIVADTNRISNPATRTLILAVLAIVDLALHEIGDALAEETPRMARGTRSAPAMMKIARYRTQKRWACRNSATGRFEKMSYCEQNPATSTVETF